MCVCVCGGGGGGGGGDHYIYFATDFQTKPLNMKDFQPCLPVFFLRILRLHYIKFVLLKKHNKKVKQKMFAN